MVFVKSIFLRSISGNCRGCYRNAKSTGDRHPGTLLVQRAYDTSRPCQFPLPGRRRKRIAIDEVEAPATAVLREVLEETGLVINNLELIQDWGDQAYFIASVKSPSVCLNKESMGYIWIDPNVTELQAAGEIMDYSRILLA